MRHAHAELVDRIVAAVTAVDGVAGLYAGAAGSAATYLPGRTVPGVRVDDEAGQVNLIVEFGEDTDIVAVADRARQAASDAAGVPIDVTVSDIRMPTSTDRSKEMTA
ncbi:Response regulator receiver protein OS=Tsukamurella paurometabola (strain ATCC 8368 / DSM /CCUG 35730 / CIP 100753 / JCM 10117 / KCTC 9821 / NBRC 16120/ NCIMB 702349 / NCTC 13040) OX=521096 GN=Tpau_4066 PE=4 SV=1 [Tsukamurella paurometabola]|uniref:Response regulator receiver protein n=1 Tax=Tsukamurella paurometabola (strain ATCC 8368 / DSM 20162 / CCUG 35730 / CIP 100753 / JCM 10117 / KCTC 9821 / NBRC 16120 / NCIMB 702349 / NCTC 13040) TaxID=521096 RepID=D5UNE1_TSUPD|nr:hypothetical protein [Tsukamurella paurometabola]ADG80636.1 response regulator receiver protein [Tsukamurella paurometabola DSM 20162]SUP40376.1 Uncharacterised protein [Tsukamurella paurometabola]